MNIFNTIRLHVSLFIMPPKHVMMPDESFETLDRLSDLWIMHVDAGGTHALEEPRMGFQLGSVKETSSAD